MFLTAKQKFLVAKLERPDRFATVLTEIDMNAARCRGGNRP
jgi:hypothetical protein